MALLRAAMRDTRRNLGVAFGYVTLGVPAATEMFDPVFDLLLSPAANMGWQRQRALTWMRHVEKQPETSRWRA